MVRAPLFLRIFVLRFLRVTSLCQSAVELLAQAKTGGNTVLRTLGEHPDDKAPVEICSGRYGAYARHGKVNATLPKDVTPEAVTLEEALELIAAKAAKGGTGKAKTTRKPAAKKTTAKTATKKKTEAKTTVKKSTTEKPAVKKTIKAKTTTTKVATKKAATKPATKKATTKKKT